MLREFLRGRYGIDNFSIALIIISALISNIKYVWIAGLGLTGYAVFRMLSRNVSKRYQELQKFNKVADRVKRYLMPVSLKIAKGAQLAYNKYSMYKIKLQQGKQYVFMKCPNCKNTLRVPRNKGKLLVSCPVCKVEFIRKT